jgi:transcription antitermination protein NusB
VPVGRRSARRKAAFALYQQDLLQLTPEAALARAEAAGELDGYTKSLISGVGEHQAEIDAELGRHVAGWTVDRLGNLERSILRLAMYELRYEIEVPPAVVVDEAVELAKRFCSDEAAALVNGVLGSVVKGSDTNRD